jgi:hypothetical protein
LGAPDEKTPSCSEERAPLEPEKAVPTKTTEHGNVIPALIFFLGVILIVVVFTLTNTRERQRAFDNGQDTLNPRLTEDTPSSNTTPAPMGRTRTDAAKQADSPVDVTDTAQEAEQWILPPLEEQERAERPQGSTAEHVTGRRTDSPVDVSDAEHEAAELILPLLEEQELPSISQRRLEDRQDATTKSRAEAGFEAELKAESDSSTRWRMWTYKSGRTFEAAVEGFGYRGKSVELRKREDGSYTQSRSIY